MEYFQLTSYDGHMLSGICFVPEREPKFLMVVAHGFRGQKENSGRIFDFAQKIEELGGVVVAFDFAGSGESEGLFVDMTLSRQARDMKAVIDFFLGGYALPLIVLGRSFGGSTAIAACAADPRVDGLILWSAPVLLEETFAPLMPDKSKPMKAGESVAIQEGQDIYYLGSAFAMDFADHDLIQCLRETKVPILVVHGEDDSIVAVKNAILIDKNAGGSVDIHLVAGADHRFEGMAPLRDEITLDWIKKMIRAKE